jgi:hypothetical protein
MMKSLLFLDLYRWLRKPDRKSSRRACGVERLEPRTVLSASGFADGPHYHSLFSYHEPLAPYPTSDFSRPMSGHSHDTRGERFRLATFERHAWEPHRYAPPPIETGRNPPTVPLPAPVFEPRSSSPLSQRIEPATDFAESAGRAALPAIRPSGSGGGDVMSVDIVFAELGETQSLAERSWRSSDLTNASSPMIPLMDDDWSLDSWNERPFTGDNEDPQPSIVRDQGKPAEGSADSEGLIELEPADARRWKRKPLGVQESQEDDMDELAAALDSRRRLRPALDATRFAERSLLEWLPTGEGNEFGNGQRDAIAIEDEGLMELPVLTAGAAISSFTPPPALPLLELRANSDGVLEAAIELYQVFETAADPAAQCPLDTADLRMP